MKLLYFSWFFCFLVYGETQVSTGEARENGILVYSEKQTTVIQDKKVQSSVIEYSDTDGKLLGRVLVNYEKSLNAPEYEMTDFIRGTRQGVRYKDGLIEMFFVNQEKEEKTKTISKSEMEGKLVVSGQGLLYYLAIHIEEIIQKGKVDLLFLSPGRLDAYDFCIEVVKKDQRFVNFEIQISSWFLKPFVPKLKLFYDREKLHLIKYSGPSNIKTGQKELKNVEITYQHSN